MVDPWMVCGKDEVWGRRYHCFGSWMLWGTGDVWVDVIMVFGPWVQRATDEAWVHETMALIHGCFEGRMRSGWT